MAHPQKPSITVKLEQCLNSLKKLEKTNPVQKTFVPQLKEFLQCLSGCLPDIQEVMALPCNEPRRAKIWLCLSQLSKTLLLLGSYSQSRQTVWYLSERLQCCLTELTHALDGGDLGDSQRSDSFVHQMEVARDLLDSEGGPALDSWNKTIHDVICHAVTIAKVALETDCKEINSTCEKLLLESNQLTEGGGLDSFLTGALSHNLNTLEWQVNAAVLRLLLEVFSEPNKPLRQLVSLCGRAPELRCLSDLDAMVAALDIHVERLLLVGQYTVSCRERSSCKAKMKCCLASLESVDNYLVPAVTAFYLEPDCSDQRTLVKLLCDHWQAEVTSLYSQVESGIYSASFTKVVWNSIEELHEKLLHEVPFEAIGQAVVNQGSLLLGHLSRTSDSSVRREHLAMLKAGLRRCQSKLLTGEADPHTIASYTKDIIHLLENISEHLDEFYQNITSFGKTLEEDCNISNTFGKGDPESSKPNSTILAAREKETNLLTPYLNRVEERSTTLYARTPRKYVQSEVKEDNLLAETSEWNSFTVDVTEILENLSKLADTLSSQQEDSSGCQQVEVRSCESLDIGSPTRLLDIRHLDQKIRTLKLS